MHANAHHSVAPPSQVPLRQPAAGLLGHRLRAPRHLHANAHHSVAPPSQVCSGTVFARHAIHVAPLRGPGQLIKDTELIFLTVASVFSVLGLVVSPLFFCFHLLDIVNKFSDLQNVFKAVTLNGSTILLTGIFGGLVVWIYAIVGYALMADLS